MNKILIITDAWDPQINGVVRWTKETIKNLEKNNFDIKIINPNLFWSVKLPFYKEISLSLFPKQKIKKIIQEYNPDFLHIVTEGPLGFTGKKVADKLNIKYTTAYHTHFANYIEIYSPFLLKKILYKLTNFYIRKFHQKSQKVFVSTNTLKEELEKNNIKNVVVCHLGVNTDLFRPKNFTPPIQINKPIFTYFGRVAKEKNIQAFFDCKLPGTKLIIGDGPLRQELENKHKDAFFVGYKTGEDLVNWLSISDVFVFPSKTDTFGLVIIEALATGIPVAGYDTMGPKDIITNGINGFIGNNLEDSAIKCLEIDKNNCRNTALKYSWENSTKIFIENLIRN